MVLFILKCSFFVKPNFCFQPSFLFEFFQILLYVFVLFRVKLPPLFYFSDMEQIGNKDFAIAERVRELLAAANSSSSAAAAAVAPPIAVVAPVSASPPSGVRRLDPTSTDPATVVANLTVAGIRYAVSYFEYFIVLDGCIIDNNSIPSVDPYNLNHVVARIHTIFNHVAAWIRTKIFCLFFYDARIREC
jgi:hypothetical protein